VEYIIWGKNMNTKDFKDILVVTGIIFMMFIAIGFVASLKFDSSRNDSINFTDSKMCTVKLCENSSCSNLSSGNCTEIYGDYNKYLQIKYEKGERYVFEDK
jgi:hypothetical protein